MPACAPFQATLRLVLQICSPLLSALGGNKNQPKTCLEPAGSR
jgi:hypothetical protein